jgi:hypothetical protein
MAMRRIYQAVVIPQMLYDAAAWYQASMPAKKMQPDCPTVRLHPEDGSGPD